MSLSLNAPEKFRALPGAAFVDLDDTLYAYRPSHDAAMAQVRQKAARLLSIAPRDFDGLFEEARRQVKARLGRTAASHSRLLYFQRLIELAGLKTQVLTALDFDQTYWRCFLTQARLFDYALEFLDDLRHLNVPIVIVTDLMAQIQFRKIVHFGLDHYIDYLVTSEEAGVDKPAQAVFDLALEKIGSTGGAVWIIGDDPATDIAGAAAVPGGISLQKLHAGVKRAEPPADATFETFAELRGLLSRIGERVTAPA